MSWFVFVVFCRLLRILSRLNFMKLRLACAVAVVVFWPPECVLVVCDIDKSKCVMTVSVCVGSFDSETEYRTFALGRSCDSVNACLSISMSQSHIYIPVSMRYNVNGMIIIYYVS